MSSKYKAIREAKNIIAEEGVSIEDRELYNLLEERFPKRKTPNYTRHYKLSFGLAYSPTDNL